MGGPVNFHPDGQIGRAIDAMGPEARIDVDGQPLADALGRVATDVVTGARTPQQGIDAYTAVRDRLPDGRARQALTAAITAMDAPPSPAPALPAGTPPALQQLMADLWQVPMVRRDPQEATALAQIAQQAAAGQLGRYGRARALRQLADLRHESAGDEGKFAIDRAVAQAADAVV